jgi:hypothetical protein
MKGFDSGHVSKIQQFYIFGAISVSCPFGITSLMNFYTSFCLQSYFQHHFVNLIYAEYN